MVRLARALSDPGSSNYTIAVRFGLTLLTVQRLRLSPEYLFAHVLDSIADKERNNNGQADQGKLVPRPLLENDLTFLDGRARE